MSSVSTLIDRLHREADQDRDPETTPDVGVIMGSDSDLDVMQGAFDALDALGFAEQTDFEDPPEAGFTYESYVVSAHRTPDLMYAYAETAEDRGLDVVIAGAGGKSADLPNMTASVAFPLPVIGVPVQEKSVDSVIGMPTGAPIVAAELVDGALGGASAGDTDELGDGNPGVCECLFLPEFVTSDGERLGVGVDRRPRLLANRPEEFGVGQFDFVGQDVRACSEFADGFGVVERALDGIGDPCGGWVWVRVQYDDVDAEWRPGLREHPTELAPADDADRRPGKRDRHGRGFWRSVHKDCSLMRCSMQGRGQFRSSSWKRRFDAVAGQGSTPASRIASRSM